MAYSDKERDLRFDEIIDFIENGESLRSILSNKEGMPSSQTFYNWIEEDETKSKRYARACEYRADKIADEIIEIADDETHNHTPFTGSNVVQRDRLRIDSRKWLLSKLHPKKYGDKIDVTSGNEALKTNILYLGNGVDPDQTAS